MLYRADTGHNRRILILLRHIDRAGNLVGDLGGRIGGADRGRQDQQIVSNTKCAVFALITHNFHKITTFLSVLAAMAAFQVAPAAGAGQVVHMHVVAGCQILQSLPDHFTVLVAVLALFDVGDGHLVELGNIA